jgi:hypothetical protein
MARSISDASTSKCWASLSNSSLRLVCREIADQLAFGNLHPELFQGALSCPAPSPAAEEAAHHSTEETAGTSSAPATAVVTAPTTSAMADAASLVTI